MPITVTEKAASEVQRIIEENKTSGSFPDKVYQPYHIAVDSKHDAWLNIWMTDAILRYDPAAKTCACPAGHTCTTLVVLKSFTDRQGERQILQGFRFDAGVCGACPLRAQCVRAGPTKGRTVSLHPQEALLQSSSRMEMLDARLSIARATLLIMFSSNGNLCLVGSA